MKDGNDVGIKRQFGRPPKPRDEVRSERVVSFVTRTELDALMELADDGGESLSTVVHRMIRSVLKKQKPQSPG